MLFKVMVAAILALHGASAARVNQGVNVTATSNHTAGLLATRGPYGGGGGNPFTDVAANGRHIVGFEIRAGNRIDRIRVLYDGAGAQPSAHGGGGGSAYYFGINATGGERVSGINLRHGNAIDAIQFETTFGRTSTFFGGSGGDLALLNFGSAGLNYITGRSGARIDQLTFHY